MSLAQSFSPLARTDASRLILGSMPGRASLAAEAYYAHPRNAFWPILAALVGFSSERPYAERVAALLSAQIAVWDVLRQCQRPGSLDSAIRAADANDFAAFFAEHPGIQRVVFNGQAAEQWFRRLVPVSVLPPGCLLLRAPSTSSAHAGLAFVEKLTQWRAALALP